MRVAAIGNRNPHIFGTILPKGEGKASNSLPKVTAVEVVQQVGAESMGPARSPVLGSIFRVARAALVPAEIAQRGGSEAADSGITEMRKKLVLLREPLIAPDVKSILVVAELGVQEEVIGEPRPGAIRRGIEIDDIQPHRVDVDAIRGRVASAEPRRRNNVDLPAVRDRVAKENNDRISFGIRSGAGKICC